MRPTPEVLLDVCCPPNTRRTCSGSGRPTRAKDRQKASAASARSKDARQYRKSRRCHLRLRPQTVAGSPPPSRLARLDLNLPPRLSPLINAQNETVLNYPQQTEQSRLREYATLPPRVSSPQRKYAQRSTSRGVLSNRSRYCTPKFKLALSRYAWTVPVVGRLSASSACRRYWGSRSMPFAEGTHNPHPSPALSRLCLASSTQRGTTTTQQRRHAPQGNSQSY
ncbi:hypothetical protein C8Q78DRAFT_739886 [Trametes maxima]|nr:hypothetical protein C8Q78DRAFT_739886 [Trametes maxima]